MEKNTNVTETIFKAIVRGVGELKGRKAVKKAMEIIAEQHFNGLVACCGFGCQRVCPVCRACSQDTPEEHAMCSEITYQIAELGNVSPTKTAKEKKDKTENAYYKVGMAVYKNRDKLEDMSHKEIQDFILKETGCGLSCVNTCLNVIYNFNNCYQDDNGFTIILKKKETE